jgi:2,3-bisphosphoglycerate-dependent phosphoglycerate mutase
MLNIYLIRHGNKKHIPFDPPLTDVGKKQAQLTAEFLKNTKFKSLVVSPKLRTKQTADAIAKKLNLPIQLDERLIERMEWEKDVAFEEFINEWDKTDKDRDFVPSVGNSANGKGALMKMVIEELLNNYKEGNIAVITHGGAISDLLNNLFSEIQLPNKTEPLTGLCYSPILECSITLLQIDNNDYKLNYISNIDHLLSV